MLLYGFSRLLLNLLNSSSQAKPQRDISVHYCSLSALQSYPIGQPRATHNCYACTQKDPILGWYFRKGFPFAI